MSDYIKRKDAIVRLWKQLRRLSDIIPMGKDAAGVAVRIIEDLPAADVAEVVRCKDCIHNDQCKHRVVMWVEDPINTWHKDIDFCSYGERKEK